VIDRKKLKRKTTATLYYVRILMGHLYEALKMIKFMAKDPQLRDMVMDCDQRIIDNFMVVERFVESPEMKFLSVFGIWLRFIMIESYQ
jgi:hypothetical protein